MTEFTDEDLREAERFLETSIMASYGPALKRQPASNNASMCGHPCAFYLWSLRARHEDLPSPDDGLPGIWAIGREAENAAQIALLQEGWNLHKTQVIFEDKDLDIRGRLDWELSHQTNEFWKQPIPTEFKGVSDNYWGALNSFDDCFASSMKWVRMWPMQVLSYAYLMPEEVPYVCLLMRNKTNARPRAIIERTEEHFQQLVNMGEVIGEVNRCLRDSAEPDPITYSPVWCKKCDAAHICPTMQHHTFGDRIAALEDPTVIEDLARTWERGNETKKEVAAAWESMKEIGRHYGLFEGGAGDERRIIGAEFIFSVSFSAKGKPTFKVERIVAQSGATNGG
jgi:CRISPR/Cas system-associated exonuclease Cas4 (RecB family)